MLMNVPFICESLSSSLMLSPGEVPMSASSARSASVMISLNIGCVPEYSVASTW
jgi:hypothetical protein